MTASLESTASSRCSMKCASSTSGARSSGVLHSRRRLASIVPAWQYWSSARRSSELASSAGSSSEMETLVHHSLPSQCHKPSADSAAIHRCPSHHQRPSAESCGRTGSVSEPEAINDPDSLPFNIVAGAYGPSPTPYGQGPTPQGLETGANHHLPPSGGRFRMTTLLPR